MTKTHADKAERDAEAFRKILREMELRLNESNQARSLAESEARQLRERLIKLTECLS